MDINNAKKKIENFLNSDKRWPCIVDFASQNDLDNFIDHFNVGQNNILEAKTFCNKDGIFKFEELVNELKNNTENTFVIRLTAFVKLSGKVALKNLFKTILSMNIKGHIIILTYQCKNYLNFPDSRFAERNQIVFVDGESDNEKTINIIDPDLCSSFPNSYCGFENIGMALEKERENTIYIASDVDYASFQCSLININQMKNGYDILCKKDHRTALVDENLGSHNLWNYALKKIGTGNWNDVAEDVSFSIINPISSLEKYNSLNENDKWLYTILFFIFSTNENEYFKYVLNNLKCYKDIITGIFKSILFIDKSDSSFTRYYNERKELIKFFTNSLDEISEYCKYVSTKEENEIYYLTDLTQLEREKIIDWLSKYGFHYDINQLKTILEKIYPDLSKYLNNYRFKNDLLDSYFDKYKYQKITNHLLPSFEAIVDEQATKYDFITLLSPRISIVDKLNFDDSRVYFLDALGVEYLGYIQAKCNEYNLSSNISCGRCELPSLTCFNKDFVDLCESKNITVNSIKDLDEIKHHGEDNFDYEKVKEPIYLIKELEIIDDLIKNIRSKIYEGIYKKAVIISDHGASRLAVIHESENLWKMATKGEHSGRCCPKNEIESKPDYAIESNGYWTLANYDRFQGSRKANVEVHGGASLEEVTVPIIEITKEPENLTGFIVDDSKVIILSAKETPKIKLYVNAISNNITVKLDNQYFDASPESNDYIYTVNIPNCTKKGIYSIDIYMGNNVVSKNNTFEIKKKGISEINLFD